MSKCIRLLGGAALVGLLWSAAAAAETQEGRVLSTNGDAGTIEVTVEGEATARVFSTDDASKVTIEGVPSGLAEIEVGDRATIVYDGPAGDGERVVAREVRIERRSPREPVPSDAAGEPIRAE